MKSTRGREEVSNTDGCINIVIAVLYIYTTSSPIPISDASSDIRIDLSCLISLVAMDSGVSIVSSLTSMMIISSKSRVTRL